MLQLWLPYICQQNWHASINQYFYCWPNYKGECRGTQEQCACIQTRLKGFLSSARQQPHASSENNLKEPFRVKNSLASHLISPDLVISHLISTFSRPHNKQELKGWESVTGDVAVYMYGLMADFFHFFYFLISTNVEHEDFVWLHVYLHISTLI